MKHTKGPWAVTEDDGCWYVLDDGDWYVLGDGYTVADCTPWNAQTGQPHCPPSIAAEANARLIAAAPELVEALQQALSVLQTIASEAGDVPFWNDGGAGQEACKRIRAALRKAGVLGE